MSGVWPDVHGYLNQYLTFKVPRTKMAEFGNGVTQIEAAN